MPAKPLASVSYAYLGDARNNTANSLLVTGALLGLDVRICAPELLWPRSEVQDIAHNLAKTSGASLTVTERRRRRRRRSRFRLHGRVGIYGRADGGVDDPH